MCQIEKEFLAEECGFHESHVYNSFNFYDCEDIEYTEISITVSTLVLQLLYEASEKSSIPVDTLLNASIFRVLHDVDLCFQSQNKATNEKE